MLLGHFLEFQIKTYEQKKLVWTPTLQLPHPALFCYLLTYFCYFSITDFLILVNFNETLNIHPFFLITFIWIYLDG